MNKTVIEGLTGTDAGMAGDEDHASRAAVAAFELWHCALVHAQ